MIEIRLNYKQLVQVIEVCVAALLNNILSFLQLSWLSICNHHHQLSPSILCSLISISNAYTRSTKLGVRLSGFLLAS